MARVGRNIKAHEAPTPLPYAGQWLPRPGLGEGRGEGGEGRKGEKTAEGEQKFLSVLQTDTQGMQQLHASF